MVKVKPFVMVSIVTLVIFLMLCAGMIVYLDTTPEKDPEQIALQTVQDLLAYAQENPESPPPFEYRNLQIDQCWQFIQQSVRGSQNHYTPTVTYNAYDDAILFRDTSEVVVHIDFAHDGWATIRFYEYGTAGCQYGIATENLLPEG
jgi:hypothetical protein